MFSQQIIERIIYLSSIILILYILKPSLFFKSNGKVRNHGVGYDEEGYKKTLYSLHMIIIILAILFVYIN